MSISTSTQAPRRTIVVGDLHGCHDEAQELFDKLAVTRSDRVIFSGNVVDRGPMRKECVELAMKHECIRGHQEEKHLRKRGTPLEKLMRDQAITRWILEDRIFDYFESLPLYLRIPEANAVVVHAGVLPGMPLEVQPAHSLLQAQYIHPPGTKSHGPSRVPQGWSFWTYYWKGPERVIFGHTALNKPLVSNWAVGINTACVEGGSLTAVVLPEWRLVSVPARKKYWQGQGMKSFPVTDGITCLS